MCPKARKSLIDGTQSNVIPNKLIHCPVALQAIQYSVLYGCKKTINIRTKLIIIKKKCLVLVHQHKCTKQNNKKNFFYSATTETKQKKKKNFLEDVSRAEIEEIKIFFKIIIPCAYFN